MKASMLLAAALCMSTMVSGQNARPQYWGDAWRGWHFYEVPPAEDAPPESARPRSPAPASPPRAGTRSGPSEPVEFERLQSSLDEARKVAIIRPSEANVRRYMELEADIVARASTFADVAQRIAWASPRLDPSLQGRPVNSRALEVFEQRRIVDRSRLISDLGRDHVLLFFYRSDCPYCHTFAPVLLEFQARHGMKVEAVSLDGGAMPGFPAARRDNGIASALRVDQVPAVYLAQPFNGTITPIGFGVLSEAQLVERIAAVSAPGYRAMVPSALQQLAVRGTPKPNALAAATGQEVPP